MLAATLLPMLLDSSDGMYSYTYASTDELFAEPLETLGDFKSLIERFEPVIKHRYAIPAAAYEVLDEDDSGTVDSVDMLYWVDRKLKESKVSNGGALDYTDRLSEMSGWGEAEPDSLAEADPLDLVTTLEGLGCKVVIVDHDADLAGTNNLSASSTDGCVRVLRVDDNSVRAIDGTTTKTPNDNLLNASEYRFKLWYTLEDLNESAGGNLRFPNDEVESVMLVRYSVEPHVVGKENMIGCTTPGQAQNSRITLRGYPGEWPEIWCGNSMGAATGAENDTTPVGNVCPWSNLDPKNGTATIFRIGQSSSKFRNNFHICNIHFHGKRPTAGGKWIFCGNRILRFGAGTNMSVRHCKFTDLQPIADNDYNAAAFPDFVDFAHSARSERIYGAFESVVDNFVCDSNLIEPASKNSWPNVSNSTVVNLHASTLSNSNSGKLRFTTASNHGLTSGKFSVHGHAGFTGETKNGHFVIETVTSDTITTTGNFTGTGGTGGSIRVQPDATNIPCVAVLFGNLSTSGLGDGTRVTRNRFLGVSLGALVQVRSLDGVVIADNEFEGYSDTSLTIQNCTDMTVERNRFHDYCRADYEANNGGHAIQCSYSSGTIIRRNVFFMHEPQNNGAVYAVWFKGNAAENYEVVSAEVYENLFYRSGLYIDSDGDNRPFTDVEIYNNVFCGMRESDKANKGYPFFYANAPILVNLRDESGGTPGTLNSVVIRDNGIWRFEHADPSDNSIEVGPHLAVRVITPSGQSLFYEDNDTLTGWTGNVAAKPTWVGDPEEDDFRITSNGTFAAYVANNLPLTAAQLDAWTPD